MSHLQIDHRELGTMSQPCFKSMLRGYRLSALIEEELSERGHLTDFLNTLLEADQVALDSELAHSTAAQQLPLVDSLQLDPELSLAPADTRPELDNSAPSTTLAAQGSAHADDIDGGTTASSSQAVGDSQTLDQHCTASVSSNVNSHSIDIYVQAPAPATGPSVLEAAISAYKQEKRQIWKVNARHATAVHCLKYSFSSLLVFA